MRLAMLESGHRLRQKLMLGMIRLMLGATAPDVVRTLLYRPEFLGKPFGRVTQRALRQSEHWEAGECELFAAFVSRQNQCLY